MSDLTASDVLAMSSNKDNGFLEGNGIIILILFFLMFGGGFGGFGNNSAALTRAELADGLSTQDIKNTLTSINETNINGFNGVNSNINSLASQMAQSCCDIKTAIHSEGETTRALIQENTIQALRDEVSAKDRELLTTGLTAAQVVQTNNLENFMRTLFNGCGCNS